MTYQWLSLGIPLKPPVGEQQSLEACELLAGTSPGNAARVINEELKEVSDSGGPGRAGDGPGMSWLHNGLT